MEYQFESIGPALRFVVLVCLLVFAVAPWAPPRCTRRTSSYRAFQLCS